MSRKPQTCADCARRKIRCNKVIPCDNCQKRGSAHLCRRAEVTQTTERRQPSVSLSPRSADPTPSRVRREATPEPSINEKILDLVTTLSKRVQQLESKLDGNGLPPQPEPHLGVRGMSEEQDSTSIQPERPSKRPRTRRIEDSLLVGGQEKEVVAENESTSGQNGSEADVEDAATVLEFLAWGRLKESNITSGIRNPSIVHATSSHADQDIIQNAQAWGNSPSSMPGAATSMESMHIPQVQSMLPTRMQVYALFEYHSNWLLFMHGSFHVPTFRQELDQFYEDDQAVISTTSVGLQWTALLFTILCGSMTAVKSAVLPQWGFHSDDQSTLAHRWYQASVECLNIARYQQYHTIYGIQAITSLTMSAHILGFSNAQSVLLASAIRIAQSMSLHRLGKVKAATHRAEDLVDTIQNELGRRLWQQLATQDWFSVPFSETYCINPLHFSSKPPHHCDEDSMKPLPSSLPAITTYGNFLFKIAKLMPALLDRSSLARNVDAKYEEVLRFDKMMRELVLSQLPACLNSQTSIDHTWPSWVALARRCLTTTSAHKIIMIHRKFLGMSFHDERFAFTRRTCLAAAKTIINELKQDLPDESPVLWTTQAFSVAAAIILSLDNFSRHQTAREYGEHRRLIAETISILSKNVAVSSIAVRGTRLLTDLMAEEYNHTQGVHGSSHCEKGKSKEGLLPPVTSDRSLNVAAFVRKFCETDQPQPGSPLATSHMPLWLQQENSFQSQSGPSQKNPSPAGDPYPSYQPRMSQASFSYGTSDMGHQLPSTSRQQHQKLSDPFAQNISDSFDIRTVNWFDDLLGLAPSHSI